MKITAPGPLFELPISIEGAGRRAPTVATALLKHAPPSSSAVKVNKLNFAKILLLLTSSLPTFPPEERREAEFETSRANKKSRDPYYCTITTIGAVTRHREWKLSKCVTRHSEAADGRLIN